MVVGGGVVAGGGVVLVTYFEENFALISFTIR